MEKEEHNRMTRIPGEFVLVSYKHEFLTRLKYEFVRNSFIFENRASLQVSKIKKIIYQGNLFIQ